jgi:hypothetical protein
MVFAISQFDKDLRAAFARMEPDRDEMRYMVLQKEPMVVVRIYSYMKGKPKMRPTPYQIFEFNPHIGELRKLCGEEATPYVIKNYK